MSIATFLQQIDALLKAENATEHSYRPALAQLFNAVLAPAQAINEPKHKQYGAPDFVIQHGASPIGHIEAKDVDVDLEPIINDSEKAQPKSVNGKQLKRYRAALPNLLYTNGLDWHWFVDGKPRLMLPTCIGTWNPKTKQFKTSPNAIQHLTALLDQFAAHDAPTVTTPQDLAQRLAQVARWIDEVINQIFAKEDVGGSLHRQIGAFRDTLLPNLSPAEFADMYAQTLVYGLFAARVAHPTDQHFSRLTAWNFIPKTNPFLRRMFHEVTADDLDPDIAWLVDDCARLLAHTDMSAVMADFGTATQQQDPVVHFYETFLQAYDPKLRETRGVYYTPEPVVSYLVRSVDALLRTRFNKPLGLADEKTIVLDPATGTGTFLHRVVQQIHENLVDQGIAGMWDQYVPQNLLPRIFGFELLMAPYTVAHLKLGLLLGELGYQFGGNERLGVYLTNTIANLPAQQTAFAFAQAIAEEGGQANHIKQSELVMVVIGNPPYSNFGMLNKGDWIRGLLEDYKRDLGEKKINLDDDYIKFIRFGQWRIERTGSGILAFITNNSYIDGITHRRMRQSLIQTFTDIYVLDLHGSSKKQERTPDGSKDENVFDIQQGVAISIFVKEPGKTLPGQVHHANIWGSRTYKYQQLLLEDINSTPWVDLSPSTENYFFVPKNMTASEEYLNNPSIIKAFVVQQNGIKTDRDALFFDTNFHALNERIRTFYSERALDPDFRDTYRIENSSSYNLLSRRLKTSFESENVRRCLYRPFDQRWVYYTPRLTSRPAWDVMQHMIHGENIALISSRTVYGSDTWQDIFVTQTVSEFGIMASRPGNSAPLFPLYLYRSGADRTYEQTTIIAAEVNIGTSARQPNLAPAFIADVTSKLNLQFVADGMGDLQQTWGPEDIFHYAYAIFHSPTYRTRYAEFLKIDFPRLPLTNDRELFAVLVAKGAQLVDLHLLRLPGFSGVGGAGGAAILSSPGKQGLSYPIQGTNVVEKMQYKASLDEAPGYVVINDIQRFTGIDPETWEMHIGGYQPLEKWLKDRKGQKLTTEDVQHYLRIIIALRETRRIMAEIDSIIPAWPFT